MKCYKEQNNLSSRLAMQSTAWQGNEIWRKSPSLRSHADRAVGTSAWQGSPSELRSLWCWQHQGQGPSPVHGGVGQSYM